MLALVEGPIDRAKVADAVRHPGAGAVLIFEGDTRATFDNRVVVRLEYEAYSQMAIPVMTQIADEIGTQWPGTRVAMVHRVGEVPVGEGSVIIAVSAPHREAAYHASRAAIDRLKARVPIWKREVYMDGSEWKANRAEGSR